MEDLPGERDQESNSLDALAVHALGAFGARAPVAAPEAQGRVELASVRVVEVAVEEGFGGVAVVEPADSVSAGRDRVGVLAAVLAVVSEAGWNVQEMENVIFAGAEAACARIRFDGTPDDSALDRIRDIEHVLNATVMGIG